MSENTELIQKLQAIREEYPQFGRKLDLILEAAKAGMSWQAFFELTGVVDSNFGKAERRANRSVVIQNLPLLFCEKEVLMFLKRMTANDLSDLIDEKIYARTSIG